MFLLLDGTHMFFGSFKKNGRLVSSISSSFHYIILAGKPNIDLMAGKPSFKSSLAGKPPFKSSLAGKPPFKSSLAGKPSGYSFLRSMGQNL